ncbi:zymogen granule membrane 16-like protein [Labeo rohita]|uniref:Zymogen granule membrane 16-like protein n=1 Tax=Labeo rohita TaxID=84645 RepID=A0A498LET4_LABRO|nr:zymogen granule membrane 16-like protein [Labeo rohita]
MAMPLPDIRVWEYSSAYISGYSVATINLNTDDTFLFRFQLSYEGNWTTLVCASYGNPMEMTLHHDEAIIQVSGKYDSGYMLMFVTSQGRSLKVGQPSGISFNLYPTHDGSELRFLSGRHNGYGITFIGAHWAVYHSSV